MREKGLQDAPEPEKMIRQLAKGMMTFVPGAYRLFSRKSTGGTGSARYCYAVWLRHLVKARESGFPTNPQVVAELGPGDSIGIGLASLMSGAERYYAFDVIEYSTVRRNLAIFDELVELFERREDIPGEDEFPEVKPYLDSYAFPGEMLTDDRLDAALDDERLQRMKRSILDMSGDDSMVRYQVPWNDSVIVEPDSVDMIFSQAVLEHVGDPDETYGKMHAWLKPGGFISHSIDFRSHGTADEWNGHWTCSDLVWKLIAGRRPYLINRLHHGAHIGLMEKNGFTVVCDVPIRMPSTISRRDLAPRFTEMGDDDLVTGSAFIQAAK
jgi:SAM-dependent methyltransferase